MYNILLFFSFHLISLKDFLAYLLHLLYEVEFVTVLFVLLVCLCICIKNPGIVLLVLGVISTFKRCLFVDKNKYAGNILPNGE